MLRKKRVLMFVYGFIPDDPRVITEARTMNDLNYDVHTIGAAFSNGFSGNHSRDGITINIIPIINRLQQIPKALWYVIRAHIPQDHEPAPTPPASNAISLIFFYLWILRLSLFRHYDIIHAHEHQAMPIAWLLAKLKRIKWIYDAHEYVPGNREHFKTFKARMAIRTESFFLKRADTVITVGKRLANDLRKRGVSQVVIIGNWKPLSRYVLDTALLHTKRQEYRLESFKLVVSYFGVLNKERQIDVLIDAVTRMPDVGLLIAGKGDLRERVVEVASHHPNIIWLDWLAYDQIPLYTGLCDVIYACLTSVSGNPDYMAPNKLFDAFAAGKALIARKGLGEIGEILQDENAGILLDNVSAESVSDAFQTLIDNQDKLEQLQANALDASQRYNWRVAEERLASLYQNLTGKNYASAGTPPLK